ncbi:HAD family hydrolase [Streptomyces sp. NPDC088254]|uniref:HAD family hydrolase n=1 Tax=Streptomyces sp. NPDC088254 TaxID=3365847 RepID=UPI003807AD06
MAHLVDDSAGPAAERAWIPTGLAVFDMDGTLLPNTTACRQIGLAAGDGSTVEQLEQAYRDRLIDSTQFAERCLESWAHAGPNLYRHAFAACPRIGGLEATLARLRELSIVTCLITMAPRPFAECFTGFDHVFASSYPHDILNPEDKPEIVRQLQLDLGLEEEQIIALGDSDSDVPLFRTLSRTVAVNASTNLRELAACTYDGDDIQDAVRSLFAVTEPRP